VPVVYYIFDRLASKRLGSQRKKLVKKIKARQSETSIA
jgi:hypothetical protein